MPLTDNEIREAVIRLLSDRLPPATVCPSEVARALSVADWRPLMPRVRAVAVAMAAQGLLELRQGDRTLAPHAPPRGPIRLGHVAAGGPPATPDGRYFVVRGRLWRKSNPQLPPAQREELVRQLMAARRVLRGRAPEAERRAAREQVDRLKRALGERGPVWWTDGAPDFNRRMAVNTPYRDWFLSLPEPD